MNLPGDLQKPCQLYVIDGERRTWTLRKRPIRRLVFAGYIDQISRSSGPSGTTIKLADPISRMLGWVSP